MKHIFTILLLLCSFNFAFADNEVDMKVIESTGTMPRSLVQKPRVQLERDLCQLSIKLAAPNESFTVCVYDEKGAVIYQDNVITDGAVHFYMLPKLDWGSYSITIDGDKRNFEGEFNI